MIPVHTSNNPRGAQLQNLIFIQKLIFSQMYHSVNSHRDRGPFELYRESVEKFDKSWGGNINSKNLALPRVRKDA